MTEKQLIEELNKYNASAKTTLPKLLSEEVVRGLNDAIKNEFAIEDKDLQKFVKGIQQVPKNNFSKVEKLSHGTIAIMASMAYYEAKDANKLDDPDRCLDPFYRQALEMASNTHAIGTEAQEQAKKLNDKMAEQVLANTLAPVKGDALSSINDKYKDKATKILNTNRLEQLTIAKTMLLTHLGSMHIVQKDGRSVAYKGSVADSMAHGGRTLFFLPRGNSKTCNETQSYYFSNQYSEQIGEKKELVKGETAVKSRLAATHTVSAHKPKDGAGSYKEGGFFTLRNNYQMNPAIGGLGQKFGDKPIYNDGLNGQMFIQMQSGDSKKGGYIMVGFENEQSGTTGRTGHKHNAQAKAAKLSSLMGGKGGPGASKGGRVVDLSMYKPEELNELLDKFNDRYTKLQLDANNPESERLLNDINKALCGKIMNPEAILDVMQNKLGIDVDKSLSFNFKDIVEKKDELAQKGFAKLDAKAEQKLAESRGKLGVETIAKAQPGEELYRPQNGLQNVVNGLAKAKKTLQYFRGESDKVKKIKLQLADLTDACAKGTISKAEAKKALSNLYESTASYITDPSKNQTNKRMAAIKVTNEFIRSELKNLGVEKDAVMPPKKETAPKAKEKSTNAGPQL